MAVPQPPNHAELLKSTFDAVAGGYDSGVLRFFPDAARILAGLLPLHGDEEVLDVATGTGHLALAIAPRVPEGRVTGVDFAESMLAKAREKAVTRGVGNVRFVHADMQQMPFAAGVFDAAACGFGIFFAEDMDRQLAHIAATVKAGGPVAISCFQEDYMSPCKELMMARLQTYGVEPPPQPWRRIAQATGCKEFFAKAGLMDVRVEQRNVGYYLAGAEQWWEVIWNAGFRRMVTRLSPDDRDRFRKEHLREVAALQKAEGLWLDVGVLFTVGTKA